MESKVNSEDVEVQRLTTAIYLHWGYDFRDYASESFKRRVWRIVRLEKLESITALQELLLRDPIAMKSFCDEVLVGVTSMFRDPGFYRAFRTMAIPILKERSALRIWHAGCATGEEVYSMAILLNEEGLFDRSQIYATDLNGIALDTARQGMYSSTKLKEFERGYSSFGGRRVFSEYYDLIHGDQAQNYINLHKDLSRNITWAQHNLATDASFNEFDLILCRNVLFYFNVPLQERVYSLICQSLTKQGLLVLGNHETLRHTSHEINFYALDRRQKIFQRRSDI